MNVFYKESESKKKYFFFLFCFGRGGGGRGEGEAGMARVSECFTKDPNKKNCFWRGWGGGWRGGGG